MNATFDQTLIFIRTLGLFFFIRSSQPNLISYQLSVNQRWARTPVSVWWYHPASHSPKLTYISIRLGQTIFSYNLIPLIHSSDSIHYFFHLFHLNLISIPALSTILNSRSSCSRPSYLPYLMTSSHIALTRLPIRLFDPFIQLDSHVHSTQTNLIFMQTYLGQL